MTSDAITLAIETSNPGEPTAGTARHGTGNSGASGGVALLKCDDQRRPTLLGEEWLNPPSARDDDLVPAIDRLTRRVGIRPKELSRVAVSVGPGGFTGVRIAIAVTKSICEATGAQAVAVPTAIGIMHRLASAVREDESVVVCLAWKRADVWRALFPSGYNATVRTGALPAGSLTPLERLFHDVHGPAVCVMGAGLEERLQAIGPLPPAIRIVRPEFDPVAIARVSVGMPAIDPLELAPLYPREPEAVTKWRELGRGR